MVSVEELLKSPELNEKIFRPLTFEPIEELDTSIPITFEIEGDIKVGGIFHDFGTDVPTILMFHGNAESSEDYDFIAELFTSFGVNMLIMDYRGYGFSTGTPTYYNIIMDAPIIYEKTLKWLKDNDYTQHIILLGRSIGGAPASYIAKENPDTLLGVIFDSTYADTFKSLMDDINLDITKLDDYEMDDWSNHTYISQIEKPILVIHGEEDEMIPVDQGREVFNFAMNCDNKRIEIIPEATHNDIMYFTDEYFGSVEEFIKDITKSN